MLVVLGLEGDLHAVTADDKVGRKLQDLALMPELLPPKRQSSGKFRSIASTGSML